jgi:hypothetical protein
MRVCSECGKEYEEKSGNSKCCSKECSYERFKRLRRETYDSKRRNQKELTNADKIDMTAKEAQENGMSYGKWVACKEYHPKFKRIFSKGE